MVSTKYIGSKTKCTLHPMIGFGARYNFKNNIFIKVEYNYLFTKKKQLSYASTLVNGANNYNLKTKAAVKHGESVMRIGPVYKFQG